MKKVKINRFSVSYRGRRKKNEDNVLIKINKQYPQMQAVVAAADGMGGYREGNMASKIMIKQMEKLCQEKLSLDPIETADLLERHIKEANRQIYDKSKKIHGNQMGTTVSGAVVIKNNCLFFNVGDSRTYIINQKGILQVTQDHSADMELIKNGIITPEEIGQGYYSHALTRSIGTDPEVEIDIFPGNQHFHILQEDEIILTCTDGLWNVITEQDIYREIMGRKSLKHSLEALASLALLKNSPDNISIAALEYGHIPRQNLHLDNYPPAKKLHRYAHPRNILLHLLLILSVIALLAVVGVLVFKLIDGGN